MKAIILSVLFLGLAACSSGGGGGDAAAEPLTKDQEKATQRYTQERVDVTSATSDFSSRSSVDVDLESQVEVARAISQKGQQYKLEVSGAAQSANCEITNSPGTNTAEEIEIGVEIGDSVDGTCPLMFNMEQTTTINNVQISGVHSNERETTGIVQFEVMDFASLYLAMDIFKYDSELSSTAKTTFVESTGTFSSTFLQVKSGNFHSKKHGVVPFFMTLSHKASGSVSTESGSTQNTQTISYTFKDFTASGVAKLTQSTEDTKVRIVYLANGVEIKKNKFIRLFGDVLISEVSARSFEAGL